jgi:hypothetical protein
MGRYLEIARETAAHTAGGIQQRAGTAYCERSELSEKSAELEHMIKAVCRNLSITPEQLRQELEEGGDLQDLLSGALTSQGLRLTAETLARTRYSEPASDGSCREARRQQVLSMLAQDPSLQYAMVTDMEAEPDAVRLTLAIKDKGTCELYIPQDRYDGLALLQVIEEQTGGSYAKA